jgi:hypothetical protein
VVYFGLCKGRERGGGHEGWMDDDITACHLHARLFEPSRIVIVVENE